MKTKIRFWHKLHAGIYFILSCVIRRACLRHLCTVIKLPNLYTHHWVCVQRPVQIINNEYKKEDEWIFECKECCLRIGRWGIYAYWVKNYGDNNSYWRGSKQHEEIDCDYFNYNCRELNIKSIID